jgi:metallo-beta-lactamase family protein
MTARITFYGGAGEVTGSCYLIDTGAVRFLIDCGMFQGGREAEAKNRATFSFDPRELAFVLLSHAHIDHSGLLPRLAAQGFNGPVYATPATLDLAAVMLPDSGYIQEREARDYDARRRRTRKVRRETAPLYTVAQAQESLKLMRGVDYEKAFAPHPDVSCTFHDAGHILGSAIVEVVLSGPAPCRIVFSGDLGQPGRPIVEDPARVEAADILLVESTYGDRCHKGLDATLVELTAAIGDTIARKRGNVVIPAFAVGRTQDLLFVLAKLWREGKLPALDIYVDSPMALAATEITARHAALFDREGREMMQWLRNEHHGFRMHFIQDVEDSIALNDIRCGAIIISASGMCDAGRIKHHLRHNLGRAECSVVIVGFQAAGSLGRRLVERVPRVRLFGQEVSVRADIYTIGGLSAHADQAALLRWLGGFRQPPGRVFIVHGEPLAAEALRREVAERFGWRAQVPKRDETALLST